MKQNQINTLPKLDNELLENIFNVYQENGMYFYNILQSIQFPQVLPSNLFTVYRIVHGDTWPFISYKTLKSPNLWWLLLLVNNITNPLEPLKTGSVINVPVEDVTREVLMKLIK